MTESIIELSQFRKTLLNTVCNSGRVLALTFDGLLLSTALGDQLLAAPAQFELSSLNNGFAGSGNGENGFVINGIDVDDRIGFSVSNAGDVNGDGVDDLLVGAPYADPNRVDSGEVYVVFGGNSVGSSGSVELSALDGADGFTLFGWEERAGMSVSAGGDVNDDGIEDLLVGSLVSSPFGLAGGESYVVFGSTALGNAGNIDLNLGLSTSLDGDNGFIISADSGVVSFGRAVSAAGDLNDDGVDDLLIGAPYEDGGETYVLFGRSQIGDIGTVPIGSLLDGSNGFVLTGVNTDDQSGLSISNAGDVNGDAIDDLLIGAPFADPNGSSSGETYVVFGSSVVGSGGSVELSALDGSDGFVLNGIGSGDRSGNSVAALGDVNGDGLGDMLIGARNADSNGSDSGETYVVFGAVGLGSTGSLELWSPLDGNNGFVLNGIDVGDRSGGSVSGVGDVNGDGVNDLLIGASSADSNGGDAGESYLVFGGSNVGNGGVVELSALGGDDGFVLNGVKAGDSSGHSVSGAGDVNGDGLADLLIGAQFGNIEQRGESYVVFGKTSWGPVMSSWYQNPAPGVAVFFWSGSNGGLTGFDEYRLDVGSVVGSDDLKSGASTTNEFDDISNLPNDGRTIYVRLYYRMSNENVWRYEDTTYIAPVTPVVTLCNGLGITVDLNLGQSPTPGADVILGTAGDDEIRGKAGDDTICGMGGDDFIHGNSGNDWIDGGDGVDNLRGGQGDDVMHTGSGSTVGTSSRAFGGYGDDEINGGPDADDLRGGRGLDILNGAGGDDLLYGNDGADDLNGGTGLDTLNGGNGDDDLHGGANDDVLNGGGGDDSLNGGGGTDHCDGGAGNSDTATDKCESVVSVP